MTTRSSSNGALGFASAMVLGLAWAASPIAAAEPPRTPSAAAPSASAGLVTGDAPHLQSVIAGVPPTAEIRITPVAPKMGTYPLGTEILHQALNAPQGGFRVWFDVFLKNWDPNQDDSPKLTGEQVKLDGSGWLGANANPPNPGVDLMPPVIQCGNNSDCAMATGDDVSKRCDFSHCKMFYQNEVRPDWFCVGNGCVRDCENTFFNSSPRCFAYTTIEEFIHDNGFEKYLATLVLDVPMGAHSVYTIALVPDQTILFTADNGPPVDIPIARLLNAYVNIAGPPISTCEPANSAGVPKNRALSMTILPASMPSPTAALRVKLIDLQNPVPPNSQGFPPPNFSTYESGPMCGDPDGCVRWVGPPREYYECSVGNDPAGTFKRARLQCTPYYHDWGGESLFHITGAEVMPSSAYDVEILADTCMGNESTCGDVSAPIRMLTSRHGDIGPPFNPPAASAQPDALDVVAMLDKFACRCGSYTKAQTQLQPNEVESFWEVNALDAVQVTDAFRGRAYPYSGPCPCPSMVACDDVPCTSAAPCGSGLCVKTCVGGDNGDEPCRNDEHCPGGMCGAGYCRDACGRCTP